MAPGLSTLGALLAHLLIAGYSGRLLFVTLLSLFPGLRAQIPDWTWYHFPKAYAGAEILIELQEDLTFRPVSVFSGSRSDPHPLP
jgi:hypothetical protein